MQKLKQIDWESGMSESISFLLLFPFVLTCMYIMFYAMQTSYVRQSLQYTVYCATRAAVVYDNYDDGVAKANEVVDKALPHGRMGIKMVKRCFKGRNTSGTDKVFIALSGNALQNCKCKHNYDGRKTGIVRRDN